MIARATGGFLLTMVVAFVLVGSFDTTRQLLVALGIAAAVGVGAAYWLERDEPTGPPDVFDERATRRAVRRGVVRTALVAVVWVFVGLMVVQVATGTWQSRGDRPEHFALVAAYGFAAAHPGFRAPQRPSCCNTGFRTTEASVVVEPRTASGLAGPVEVDFHLDLLGRLKDEWRRELPRTGVDVAGGAFAGEKRSVEKLLAQLPRPAVATAVGELAKPLTPGAFYALLDRHGLAQPDRAGTGVYVESAARSLRGGFDGKFPDVRVSWPSPSLAQFQDWVKQLRPADDPLLDELGLPRRDRLRRLAARPRVYGFVLDGASPAALRSLMADPAVRALALGDVALWAGARG